jgi:hypothetical protein
MAGGVEYDEKKLKELVIYVANRSLDDPFFGKTKLNKILYFSDFQSFRQHGVSISGAVYQHLPQGPCPQRMLPVLNALESDDQVVIVPEEVGGGLPQERIVAMRPPQTAMFTKEEIFVVEEVLTLLRKLNNTQASERSHNTMSWKLTRNKQEIPYGAALISSAEPSEEDLTWLEGLDSDGLVGA